MMTQLESDLKMWSDFERPRMTLGFYTPLGRALELTAHPVRLRELTPFLECTRKKSAQRWTFQPC